MERVWRPSRAENRHGSRQGDFMRVLQRTFIFLVAAILGYFGTAIAEQQKDSGSKPTAAQSTEPAPAPIPQEAKDKKNPVTPTPEGLATARKLYGYHCAMCHGQDGDGKGDLAVQMKLDLHDWRNPATIADMTDGELFYIITNGRGKMVGGEGDRTKEETRWNMVNLVRSFGKKTAQ